MKYLCFLLCLTSIAFGAKLGDTYEQVIAEKGKPQSQIEAGTLRLLKYPDQTIEIRNNLVVSLKAVVAPAPSAPAPAPGPTLAAGPIEQANAIKKDLAAAVTRVQRIVNQSPGGEPVSTGMNVTTFNPGWFHGDVIKPEFNTVDVRKTQQLSYDRFEYVTSDLNPGIVFHGPDLEFNPMTKFFYIDYSTPKKKLTESEMLEINRLYRIIGKCESQMEQLRNPGK